MLKSNDKKNHDAYLICKYTYHPFMYYCKKCNMHDDNEFNLVKLSLFIETHQLIKKTDEYELYKCIRR